MQPYTDAEGRPTKMTDTIFSTIPGSPAYLTLSCASSGIAVAPNSSRSSTAVRNGSPRSL